MSSISGERLVSVDAKLSMRRGVARLYAGYSIFNSSCVIIIGTIEMDYELCSADKMRRGSKRMSRIRHTDTFVPDIL